MFFLKGHIWWSWEQFNKVSGSQWEANNFAAGGRQAFDDLKNVVRVLSQLGKGHIWSEKMTGMLNEGKQCLKVQYKVLLAFRMKL